MGPPVLRLLGLDPGLRRTGWGVVTMTGNSLAYLANGVIATDEKQSVPERLSQLYGGLCEIIRAWAPDEVAVEETFVNQNPASTLKLGMARGVALLVPAVHGLPVAQYAPNQVKRSVVGVGHADKTQVQMMVQHLLPGAPARGADAADALAVAICHAHFAASRVAPLKIAARIGR